MGELSDVLASRAGEDLKLDARYVNSQMVRVLRTIGFDGEWKCTEGAYVYEASQSRVTVPRRFA